MSKAQLEVRELQRCASIFRTLSHPKRIQIVEILQKKAHCVNEIQKQIELSQAETSHHLRLLLLTGVIKNRRDGKNVYYSCEADKLKQVFDVLQLLGI
jgi:ArsR family transcriptional regulator, lead/cadmium/zinc/bismuth-responsive transcriptional repressor